MLLVRNLNLISVQSWTYLKKCGNVLNSWKFSLEIFLKFWESDIFVPQTTHPFVPPENTFTRLK